MAMKRKFIGRTVPRRTSGGKLTPKKDAASSPVVRSGDAETVCGAVSPFAQSDNSDAEIEESLSEQKLRPAAPIEGEAETVCGSVSPFASSEPESEQEPLDQSEATKKGAKLRPAGTAEGEGEAATIFGSVSPFASSEPESEQEPLDQSDSAKKGAKLRPAGTTEGEGEAATIFGSVSPFASSEPEAETEPFDQSDSAKKGAKLRPAGTAEGEGEAATIFGSVSPFASSEPESEPEPLDQSETPKKSVKLRPAGTTEGEAATVCGSISPFADSDSEEEKTSADSNQISSGDASGAVSAETSPAELPEESDGEAATVCGDVTPFADDADIEEISESQTPEVSAPAPMPRAAEDLPFNLDASADDKRINLPDAESGRTASPVAPEKDLPFEVSSNEKDDGSEGATICGDATPFEIEAEDISADMNGDGEGATICGDAFPFDQDETAASADENKPSAAVTGQSAQAENKHSEVSAAAAEEKAADAEKLDAPLAIIPAKVTDKETDTAKRKRPRTVSGEIPAIPAPEEDTGKTKRRVTGEFRATPKSADEDTGSTRRRQTVEIGKEQPAAETGADTKPPKTNTGTKSLAAKDQVTQSGISETGTNSTKGGVKRRQQAFDFRPGDLVNHYELVRLLGKGGMGSVFLARDTKLGRRVAIKFLHTKDQELARRFILEARTTARVGHENIVIIYEADEFNGMPYMALEYLQGTTLTKLIENNQPMPPGRVAELMVPVLRALVRAHSEGIVHRDLKPDNVMLTDSGTVKVLDFGISKVMGGDDKEESDKADKDSAKAEKEGKKKNEGKSELTRSGAIVGTLAYMSPEQWRAKGIDHRTDLWAAGIMLFRMLSGKHPLEGKSGMELAIVGDYKHRMPSLRDVMPNLPDDLIELVDKSLVKRKEHRWESASAMLEALEAFLPGRARKLKIDQSPYAGLSAFQEADADRFFGRNNEIAAVVNRIRDQALLGIVGASGSGKSSIVRAGVLPALKRSGENWECLVMRPGRNPLQALAEVLSSMSASLAINKDDVASLANLANRLREEPGYAGSLLRNKARQTKTNQLLFIDQFEELYTQVPDLDERLAFTACLSAIADDPSSPTRIILSIRSDFLDRVAEDMVFMNELSQGLIFLIAPNRNGLRDAIVQPAEMAGYTFESETIVNEMLDHLSSTPGALPLLQFAASKLWDNRDTSRKMLTVLGYRALGGIAGALATHADSVLNEFTASGKDLTRAIFLRLITPERTRAIVSISELHELSKDEDELKRVIDQLVRARLLVVQTSGGNATVEIVHESLVHTWPTLKRWLDETGEDAPFLENLRNATKQWQAKNLDKDQLWHGKMAEEAERFLEKNKLAGIPDAQIAYLHATVKQMRAAARRKKILMAGVAIFLVVLGVGSTIFAIYALHLKNTADENQRVAQAEKQRAEVALEDAKKSQKQAENARLQAEKARQDAEEAQNVAVAEKQRAEDSLKEVQKKEAERSAAEAKALRAAKDLEKKNKDLNMALLGAEAARKAAHKAQVGAERNAKLARKQEQIARQAEEKALKAAQEVAALLMQEQERVQRLQDQLGSPVIDELK